MAPDEEEPGQEDHVTVPDQENGQPPSPQTDTKADPFQTRNFKSLPPQVVLDPPLSSGEKMRDALLRKLDGPFFQYLGIFVLIGIVGSGALFFFFLMGWQTLCRPRTDCQPRNDIYNVAIQALNVFFTYMACVAMPWRCTNFLHTMGISCPRRENAPGHDLYGQVTDDVWFHVPLRQRTRVLVILLLNCLTQYANQVTRIIYYNYELQNEFPGTLWTNVFFAASMLCALIGGILMGHYTGKIRATDRERFGQGPVELARGMWQKYMKKGTDVNPPPETPNQEANGNGERHSSIPRASETSSEFDPTRSPTRRSVIDVNRSSLRMFGM